MSINIKRVMFLVAGVIFWVFLIFGVLEIASRFIWRYNLSLREVMRPSSDPKIIFELKPGAETIFSGQHVKIPPTTIKISPQGLRDQEYSIAKPAGTFRIIILGDSVSFGWGVELEQVFAKRLEFLLNEQAPGRYEVINFSVPGYNFSQEVATLKNKCLVFHPDLVIFSVCGNDYQMAFNYLCPDPVLEKVPSGFYKSRLFSGILGEMVFRKDVSYSRKVTEGLVEMEEAIYELKRIISESGIEVLFYQGDKRYIGELLVDHGFGERIFTSANEVFSNTRYLIEKDGHFNAEGHQKVAEDIYSFLKAKGYLKARKKSN